jgi:hypothetical protein
VAACHGGRLVVHFIHRKNAPSDFPHERGRHLALGLNLTHADFVSSGAPGLASEAFITQGAEIFIEAARVAAASTAGRHQEVLTGIADLSGELIQYRATIETFADVLAGTSLESPVAGLLTARAEFDTAVAEANAVCNPSAGDNCSVIATSLSCTAPGFLDTREGYQDSAPSLDRRS